MTANGQTPQDAAFWRAKYFELLLHSTQVITALARPDFAQQMQAHAMRLAQTQQEGAPS